MARSGLKMLRGIRRRIKAEEAAARAEAKALELGANGWVNKEGTGVHLGTLRRLEAQKKIELKPSIVDGRIHLHFRAI